MRREGVKTVLEFMHLIGILELIVALNVLECILLAAGLIIRQKK